MVMVRVRVRVRVKVRVRARVKVRRDTNLGDDARARAGRVEQHAVKAAHDAREIAPVRGDDDGVGDAAAAEVRVRVRVTS